ncbi:MAG: hypothetical protein KAW17_07170 [Candidatus Eisenbacteria sp.]|nr:hypothetical protein [Candidatus Eisenbacteria bacterium]
MRSLEESSSFRRLPKGPALYVWVFLAILIAEIVALLALNGGNFAYTLDDAYIHLALAENIAHGHYGVNASEVSAPASSILWPFLLAPFASWEVGHYVPLILNIVFSICVLSVFARILSTVLVHVGEKAPGSLLPMAVAFSIPLMNLVGLVFTGMEQTLQTLLAALLVFGLIQMQEGAKPAWWVVPVIVLGPLVRYESLALSLPALVLLGWRRERWRAILATLVLLATLGGFSLFLHAQGLGWLPTSVSAKATVVAAGGTLSSLLSNLEGNLQRRPGVILAGVLILLLFACLAPRRAKDRPLVLWASAAVLLHLLVGKFDWFSRYEIYVWTTSVSTLVYVYRDVVGDAVRSQRSAVVGGFLGVALLTLCNPYLAVLLQTPRASNNIYEQHFQMHRFAASFYNAPVAVNDIGRVSYQNRNYLLDLYGLSSREALEMRNSGQGVEWMNSLAERYGVRLAMIYNKWFPEVPENWTPIGELLLTRGKVTAASDVVTFYALDIDTFFSARELLLRFEKTLPEMAKFEFRNFRMVIPEEVRPE